MIFEVKRPLKVDINMGVLKGNDGLKTKIFNIRNRGKKREISSECVLEGNMP